MSRKLIRYDEYVILSEAASLLSEDGENPEYDRAIVELTTRLLGHSDEHQPKVAAALRSIADIRPGTKPT